MFTRNKDHNECTIRIFLLVLCTALISIVCYCFSEGISGNDFWWHIKVGEWIVENQAVPTADIFSWYGTSHNISWTAHEWLADVVFYTIHIVFGNLGIFLVSIFAALFMICLLYNQIKKYIKKNILIGGIFLALFSVLTSLFFFGRPHVFSYFLLFFELKFLYDFFENNDSKKIYCIPLLAVLWSNLHGGSSNLVYIVCIFFIVAGMFDFSFGCIESARLDKKSLFKLIAVMFASVIAIVINPIGLKVLAYPYVNLSDSLSMTVISEWQAPDAKLIGNLVLYFLPIVVMSIGIISEKKKVQFIDLLIMLAFLFLFFRSARFIILWYIAASFYAFKYMPNMKVKAITRRYEKVAVGIVAFLLLIPILMSVMNMYSAYQNNTLISRVANDEAITAIKKDNPERIFNDYNLGEALIYNDIPVFFDARADLYAQDNIMADGVSLMYLEQANKSAWKSYVDVDELINKYQFDTVAILKVRPMYAYIISHSEKFQLIYEDDDIAYFRVIEEGKNG